MARDRTGAGGSLRLIAAALALAGCAAIEPADRETSRIAVMAPAAAEMLSALGASGRVVGVGDFVSEPAELALLPRIGAYDAPNVERIVDLRADLFVSSTSAAARAAHDRLRTLGVQVLALDTSTFAGVFESLARVGRAIDADASAAEIARRMQVDLAGVQRRASGGPARSVLVVVGREPLYVAGPGSHIDELIALVGGVNVFSDVGSPWPRASIETILAREPDVIIDMSDNRPDAPRGRDAGQWRRWETLPAVRDRRVYQVHPSRLAIPGMRLPEMAGLMGRLVRPERFGEVSAADLGPR